MFANQFMRLALELAKTASTAEEVPIGAIIIDPEASNIVAQAYNLVETKKDPTAHAEMLAIQTACQKLQTKNLAGLDLYVTLQPCKMCLQAIAYARIRRIYFGAYDHSNPLNLTQQEIYGGILELECKFLLDEFFISKR